MKASLPITLQWLAAEEAGEINAWWLVRDEGFTAIPPELQEQALRIPTASARIFAHDLFSVRHFLESIPRRFLTTELLLWGAEQGNSPLHCAVAEQALDLIPWSELSPPTWVRHLDFLRTCAQVPFGAFDFGFRVEPCEGLASFIRDVEKIDNLKGRDPIKL